MGTTVLADPPKAPHVNFADRKTEAQRRVGTCLGSHSMAPREAGQEPRLPRSDGILQWYPPFVFAV